jgi:hypothetical protein
MRLCEIVMAGSPMAMGQSWQEGDSSWYEKIVCLLCYLANDSTGRGPGFRFGLTSKWKSVL